MGNMKEHPGALAMALDQFGLDKKFEMARNAWLRLAEDGHEFADRQFGLGEEGEQAQTRGLARRAQSGEYIRKGRSLAWFDHIGSISWMGLRI
jgi:hypothetical protein